MEEDDDEKDEEDEEEEKSREVGRDQEAAIMEQLHELHEQLSARRLARKHSTTAELNSVSEEAPKLIVCCVHKPVRLEKPHGVDTFCYRESYGGLKAAVDSLSRHRRVRWVSWPGACSKQSQEGVRKKLDEAFDCRPVFVDDREIEETFYVRFCHGILWPLFHSIPSPGLSDAAGIGSRAARPGSRDRRGRLGARSASDQFEAYTRVNQLFLEAVAEEYREGDLVLVYDYQLMLLPAMLRKRFPEVSCAFFLHCPFPSSEFYRMLPAREELLRGVLGADLVSFNHFDYVRHFLNACMRCISLETSKSRLEYNDRLVSVSICPAGINPDDFDDAMGVFTVSPDVPATANAAEKKSALRDDEQQTEKFFGEEPKDGVASANTFAADTLSPPQQQLPAEDLPSEPQPPPLLSLHSTGHASSSSPTSGGAGGGEASSEDAGEDDKAERVKSIAARLRDGFANRKLIVSIASLDMSKGIPQALLAMESLLLNKPEWRGVATLVLCARDRGRPYDAQLRKAVDGLVGHVNGKFGRADYCPVLYVKRELGREEMAALYSIADAVLIASVREGLNLAAMEFVACQSAWLEKKLAESEKGVFFPPGDILGVLVYSEFAGCASSFEDGALLVNPYDADGVGRALHAALTMTTTAKQVRHHKLARYINTYTAELWGTRLLRELQIAKNKASECNRVLPLDVARLRSFYDRSQRRLLIFEYGALADRANHLDQLSPNLVACLHTLCRDPHNTVYVLSGKTRQDLAQLLVADEERLGLVAEFGYNLKRPAMEWETVTAVDSSWKAEIVSILENFTRQTPGSYFEVNETSFVWHFGDSDDGPSQAKHLQLHLDAVLQNRPVRLVTAPHKGHLIVQPSNVSKGRALRRAVEKYDSYDLVFAVGDERNDDDIFDTIESSCSHAFTCTVGKKLLSRAAYFLDHGELLPTLQTLVAVSTEGQQQKKTIMHRLSSSSMSDLYDQQLSPQSTARQIPPPPPPLHAVAAATDTASQQSSFFPPSPHPFESTPPTVAENINAPPGGDDDPSPRDPSSEDQRLSTPTSPIAAHRQQLPGSHDDSPSPVSSSHAILPAPSDDDDAARPGPIPTEPHQRY